MHRLFAELEPSVTVTEQNLADQGENAEAEDAAPQLAEQTANLDAAVNTPDVVDSNDNGTVALELELEQMRSTLEEAIVETRSTPLENRPRLPRLALSKRNRAVARALNPMLVTYLEASRDLCETNSILFGAALTVCHIIGAKLSTARHGIRIEERIAKAKAFIGRLICFRSGSTRPRIVRSVRMAFAATSANLSQPDIMQKLTKRIDDLKGTNSQGTRRGWKAIQAWCIAWWHSGREDLEDTEAEEEPSDAGYATPVSVETPLQSSVSRCTSLNVIRDPFAARGGSGGSTTGDGGTSPLRRNFENPTAPIPAARDSRSLPPNTRINTATSPAPKSASADSVYTILIRLPDADTERPSIKMITEESPPSNARTQYRPPTRGDSEFNLHPGGHTALTRRTSHIQDVRIPLNAKIIPKQLAGKGITSKQPKKKKTQEKKQETKAAKTLSAILLSFIITWTPYNILVLLKPLTACTKCIPDELWSFFYALCYINSTINPVCYALCNATFRRTYVRILTCKWHNRNREAMTRGMYN
ncbi:unnamed protein product [Parnassius apollo]|uniref:(apollo) hypothetical protein n=1 Tax=Parnassius apollo TaxID=110799 RepID=A0A8S3W1C7_PARAO|nr:unnamed protein product [Parnassius apollo]